MIRTHILPCSLENNLAHSLNRASGEAYTTAMVLHWRLFHKKGVWLSEKKHSRVFTAVKGETLLHSQSYQSAVQDFYEACKTAKALQKVDASARYPYKRKFYHTTTWKGQCLTIREGTLFLPLARGYVPIGIPLPKRLEHLPMEAVSQVQLVYDIATMQNHWHITVDDHKQPAEAKGNAVLAIDLGEIHPASCTDGKTATIISCRELRANSQHRNKKTADLQELMSRCVRGSRRWHRLRGAQKKLQAQAEKKQRDLLHKVSKAIVEEAVACQAARIVMGDVREVSDKTKTGKNPEEPKARLNRENRQKIANWPHGHLRQYVEYKAAAVGIPTELLNEAYTSKTCPKCHHSNKPKGRSYCCSNCGFMGHRDHVGAINILSKYHTGKLAQVAPVKDIKYRHPFLRKRASVDRSGERQVAGAS